MDLMKLYSEQTVDQMMLWLVNRWREPVNLTTMRLDSFGAHPLYPETMKGSLIIEDWVMQELSGSDMEGWQEKLRILMLTFLNGREQGYEIVYHQLGQMSDGDWLMTFNCKEY